MASAIESCHFLLGVAVEEAGPRDPCFDLRSQFPTVRRIGLNVSEAVPSASVDRQDDPVPQEILGGRKQAVDAAVVAAEVAHAKDGTRMQAHGMSLPG